MDIGEQGAHQRQQQVRRTREDWELIAVKVQLLNPEWAAFVRDHHRFDRGAEWHRIDPTLMDKLNITGTCQPSTFVSSVAKALRTMAREARYRQKGWKTYEDKRNDRKCKRSE